ncbi:MAG TPA: hypothetical protein VJ814_08285 [Gaiellaceae bacterium]|nr:hypothetical protein [Gaiellaceae bacterium]
MPDLQTTSAYRPTGDQPQAIERLADGLLAAAATFARGLRVALDSPANPP